MYEQTLDENLWSSSDEDEENDGKQLPIDKHKYRILEHIDTYRVTCIQGETGSGKSTRVPQYLVQQYQQAQLWGVDTLDVPNIIVTQPRRIAAKSLAKRVAQELGEKDVGGLVGYRIGQDHKANEDTMICFVTSGYLIELLVHNPDSFNKYTHIILDEIHERNLDADLLSLMIKLLMDKHTRPKLIIMSATLQAELFLRYFCADEYSSLSAQDPNDHVLFVGVTSPYQVNTLYIEDVYDYCENNGLMLTLDAKKQLLRTYTKFSEVSCSQLRSGDSSYVQDEDAFEKVRPLALECNLDDGFKRKDNRRPQNRDGKQEVRTVDKELQMGVYLVQAAAEPQGSILIFLPGIREIDEMYDLLLPYEDNKCVDWKCKLAIFPLHSKMPHEDQQECFRDPTGDTCHVILATNIAESSITLPRVNVILDFGQRRHVTYDPKKRISFLKLNWCSQASMNQRKGRTGRVCDGVCFRVMTKQHFLDQIEFDAAQMRLAPLDKLILQVKYIGECIAPSDSPSGLLNKAVVPPEAASECIAPSDSPSGLLNKAVEPPEEESILTAVKNLADIGALSADDENAEVTLLGKFCMDTPLDIALCRLVFMGALFQCPADAVVMAAAIQSQDPFKQPTIKVLKNQEKFIRGQKNSFKCRRKYDSQSYSEPIMYRNVIKDWCERIDKEEKYLNEFEINSQGVKSKKFQKKKNDGNDLKYLRNKFARENEIDAKRLKLLEGVVSDVAHALLKWLPRDSNNRTGVETLINALPRNRKQYRSPLAEVTETKRWKTVEEEARESEGQTLFSNDNFLLNMLLASSFVPKFLCGSVGYDQKFRNGKLLPDRMEKLKINMANAEVAPERSICLGKPPDFVLNGNNEEAVKYMIQCISLEVDLDTRDNTRQISGPSQRKGTQSARDHNKYAFNGKDQMFIEFNNIDKLQSTRPPDHEYHVTDDVHSSIASVFQYTEGAHGRDKTVIYEITRDKDKKLVRTNDWKVKIGLPDNPFRLNFQLMSSNGTPLKSEGRSCTASCNRWRNPVSFVCDVGERPHYGVVASITAGERGTLCWVEGMSLFPIYKHNLFAVCAMLAFLPHQHKANFKIYTRNMTIAQVEIFGYEIGLSSQCQLTKPLLKAINKLRKEASGVFTDMEAKQSKKFPDCRLSDYFHQMMALIDRVDKSSRMEPESYESDRKYSMLNNYETVDGFYKNRSQTPRFSSNEDYLRSYNYSLLCDKDTLCKYNMEGKQ